MHLLEELAQRYQQLKLPICQESLEQYKEIVFGGKEVLGSGNLFKNFSLSSLDMWDMVPLSCGTVDIVTLNHRKDFENFLKIMAHKCQEVAISPSIGASILLGINNWEKIRQHKIDFEEQGGIYWNNEFKRFTSIKENYQDTLIVLSVGEYSNLPYEDTGYTEKDWLRISYDIRKNHELTHYICRKKYPSLDDAIKDEVIADAAGIIMATGSYSLSLARKVLGIAEDGSYKCGRLVEYIPESISIKEVSTQVNQILQCLEKELKVVEKKKYDLEELVDYLIGIEITK